MTAKRKISLSDAEPVKKVTINETSTSLSVVPDLTACREKPVVAMNTLDQNADAGEKLVFSMALSSARNSFDGGTSSPTLCCTMSV